MCIGCRHLSAKLLLMTHWDIVTLNYQPTLPITCAYLFCEPKAKEKNENFPSYAGASNISVFNCNMKFNNFLSHQSTGKGTTIQ